MGSSKTIAKSRSVKIKMKYICTYLFMYLYIYLIIFITLYYVSIVMFIFVYITIHIKCPLYMFVHFNIIYMHPNASEKEKLQDHLTWYKIFNLGEIEPLLFTNTLQTILECD